MKLFGAVALATLLTIGCRREYRPGDNPHCMVASCCGGGWFWNGWTCQALTPPYCGCSCQGPTPTSYLKREQCLAAHSPPGGPDPSHSTAPIHSVAPRPSSSPGSAPPTPSASTGRDAGS